MVALDAKQQGEPKGREDENALGSRSPSLRRVDWPIVVGQRVRTRPPTAAPVGSGVVSVLSAIDELGCYEELDTVLRRAVELLRDRIGLERNAIFLFSEEDNLLHGTWGTGLMGETTDEHRIAFQVGPNHREALRRAQSDTDRWLLLQNAPRTVQIERETRVLEEGWIALTPIVSARRPLGLLANDGALSSAPVVESKQTQAAVFCTLLANLIELFERESTGSETRPFRARHPSRIARTDLVQRAAEVIRRDPGIDRELLSRRLGTTKSQLGKTFKEEMGFSITEYRNRLRLEIFLGQVDRGGGNLLEAALSAGFGSYAQFHRVFCSLIGTTPKKYLTGQATLQQ